MNPTQVEEPIGVLEESTILANSNVNTNSISSAIENKKTTSEQVKESLEKGEIPQEIQESLKLLATNDPLTLNLQNELQKIFNLLYPDSNVKPIFLLSTDREINAFCLKYTDPPMIGFHLGCFVGDNALSEAAIAGIMAHEFAHYRIHKEYKTSANSKLEEGLADWYALDDLFQAKIDSTDFRKALNVLSSGGVLDLFQAIDPHPSHSTRVAIWDAWFTDQYSNQGEEFSQLETWVSIPKMELQFLSEFDIKKISLKVFNFEQIALFLNCTVTPSGQVDLDKLNSTFKKPKTLMAILDQIELEENVDLQSFIDLITKSAFSMNSANQLIIAEKLWELINKTDQSLEKQKIYARISEEFSDAYKFEEIKKFETNPNQENANNLAAFLTKHPLLCYFARYNIAKLDNNCNLKDLLSLAQKDEALSICLKAYGFNPYALATVPNYSSLNKIFEIVNDNQREFHNEHDCLNLLNKKFETDQDFYESYQLYIIEKIGQDPDQIDNLYFYMSDFVARMRILNSDKIYFTELANSNFPKFIEINLTLPGKQLGLRESAIENSIDLNFRPLYFEYTEDQLLVLSDNILKIIVNDYDPSNKKDFLQKFGVIVQQGDNEFAKTFKISLIDESPFLNFIVENTEGKGGLDCFSRSEALELLINSGIFDSIEYINCYRDAYDVETVQEVIEILAPLLELDQYNLNSIDSLVELNNQAVLSNDQLDATKLFIEFKVREMLSLDQLNFDSALKALQLLSLDYNTYNKIQVNFEFEAEDVAVSESVYSSDQLVIFFELYDQQGVYNKINLKSKINAFHKHINWDDLIKKEECLKSLINDISELENEQDKQSNLFLLVKQAATQIKSINNVSKIIEIWTDSLKAEHGVDLGDGEYFKNLSGKIQVLTNKLPKKWQKLFFESLSKKLIFQEPLTKLCASHVEVLFKNSFNDTIKEQIGADALNILLEGDVHKRISFLNFLTNERSERDISRIATIVYRNFPINQKSMSRVHKKLLQNLELLYSSFQDLPLEAQAMVKAQLLIPARLEGVGKREWRESKNFCFNSLKSNGVRISESSENFIEAYLDSIPENIPGARRVALGALLSAKQNLTQSEVTESNQADIICSIIELMGPAEVKAGQAGAGHPDTSEEYATRLARLKNHAAEPNRETLFSWIEKEVPDEIKDQITNYGQILGSGSLVVSVEVTTKTGKAVLQILRPYALERSQAGFRRLEKAITSAQISEEQKQYLRELVKQAKLDINAETDFELSKKQSEIFDQLYSNVKATLNGTAEKTEYTFKTPKLLYQKGRCRLVEKVSGLHFVDLPKGVEKTKAAKVILTLELSNILSGRFFDKDGHGGNVIIDGKIIYRIDSGAVKLSKPSKEDREILAKVISDALVIAKSKNTTESSFISSFFDAARTQRDQNGELPEILGEVQRALIGLSEYFNELSTQDIMDVLRSIYPNVSNELQIIMQDQLPKSENLFKALKNRLNILTSSLPVKIKFPK